METNAVNKRVTTIAVVSETKLPDGNVDSSKTHFASSDDYDMANNVYMALRNAIHNRNKGTIQIECLPKKTVPFVATFDFSDANFE